MHDANVDFCVTEPVVQDITAPGQHTAWIQLQNLPTFPHLYAQPAPILYCYKYGQRRVLCVRILLNPWGKIGRILILVGTLVSILLLIWILVFSPVSTEG